MQQFSGSKVVVNGACSEGSDLSVWISFLQFFVRLCFEGFFILMWLYHFSYGSLMYLLLFFHIEAKNQERMNTQFLLNHKTEFLYIVFIGWFTSTFLLYF